MNNIKIGEKLISNGTIFFVVEEGNASQGDYRKAIEMIDLACETGADAIEFQFAIASDLIVYKHERYKVWEKFQYSVDEMCDLVKYGNEKEIEFIATPLSHNIIERLAKAGVSAFNINASDINNPQILEFVAKSGLPFFISLPLADEAEIERAVAIVDNINSNFILLHGQHTMASGENGVMPEHTSLGYLETLKGKYKKHVGFIDHSPYAWMPSCAVLAGASVVTKHLCKSRLDRGPDWRICLEPNEMKESIDISRKIVQSYYTKEKVLAPGERLDKAYMRRSIVASGDIEQNKIIKWSDISFKRPGNGISPIDINKVLERRALKNLEFDQQISFDDLE